MKSTLKRVVDAADDGMATIEYALVTVAAAAFAAVLIAVVKSPEVRSAIANVIGSALGGG